MTAEQRLAVFVAAVRVAALVMQDHEARACLRYSLRDISAEELERLADAVAFIEAHEAFEHGLLGKGLQ